HPGDEDVEQDQDDVDEEERGDVIGHVTPRDRKRHHPRILSSEARTAAANASLTPSRSSASNPASVLPPGEVTETRTSAGRRMRISDPTPAAASTTSFSTSSPSRPSPAPASASASATRAKYAGEQAITAVATSNCESGNSTTDPRMPSFSRTAE